MVSFRVSELEQLLIDRLVVRLAVMRSTIHVVTADDFLPLRAALQPVLDRGMQTNHGKHLKGVDRRELALLTRSMLAGSLKTLNDIGRLLERHFPGFDVAHPAAAAKTDVPLVQKPPRGLWRAGGLPPHSPAEDWFDRLSGDAATLDSLVLRYLAALGPASVQDMQSWCGLTRLSSTVLAMGDGLVVYQDETGRELFELPDQTLPDPNMPMPVRFLPEWDTILLSYADKSRILPPEYKPRIFTKNGIIRTTVLVDGFVAGIWRSSLSDDTATLKIESFRPFDRAATSEVISEGLRLLAFLEPGSSSREVVIQ